MGFSLSPPPLLFASAAADAALMALLPKGKREALLEALEILAAGEARVKKTKAEKAEKKSKKKKEKLAKAA